LELWLNLLKIRVERDNPPREKQLLRQKTPSRKNNMLRGIHILSQNDAIGKKHDESPRYRTW
jgi:hypothetical protein